MKEVKLCYVQCLLKTRYQCSLSSSLFSSTVRKVFKNTCNSKRKSTLEMKSTFIQNLNFYYKTLKDTFKFLSHIDYVILLCLLFIYDFFRFYFQKRIRFLGYLSSLFELFACFACVMEIIVCCGIVPLDTVKICHLIWFNKILIGP